MPESAETNEETNADLPTPDRLLHTGGERPIDPEDLVRARGLEPTPERIEWARKQLEQEGPAAVERYLP
ncbi:hypothetical protein ACTWP5_14730 [Streptomyces sp. 4N509B]|uniref:hypothetical protein n=1 Tax=Streptomyces sp. 4N509B TaxID=3457413 RepID=UPI003FD32641